MISPVSRPSMQPPQRGPSATDGPGKSGQSVGHQAKAAIAASGLDNLPNNIQGKVASMIARGLDPTSLLTAPPPPPPVDTPPSDTPLPDDNTAGAGTDAPPPASDDGAPPAPDLPQPDPSVTQLDPPVTDGSAALEILKAVNGSAG